MNTNRDPVRRPEICLFIYRWGSFVSFLLIFDDLLISQFLSLQATLFSKQVIMALFVLILFCLGSGLGQ